MSARGLSHINFQANMETLERLKAFYCDVVGLQVGPRPALARPGWWLYANGKALVHLYESAPGVDRRMDAQNAFDHIAFDCEDIEGTAARLKKRGVSVLRFQPRPAGCRAR